jgi:hypothetical protein
VSWASVAALVGASPVQLPTFLYAHCVIELVGLVLLLFSCCISIVPGHVPPFCGIRLCIFTSNRGLGTVNELYECMRPLSNGGDITD